MEHFKQFWLMTSCWSLGRWLNRGRLKPAVCASAHLSVCPCVRFGFQMNYAEPNKTASLKPNKNTSDVELHTVDFTNLTPTKTIEFAL